MDFTILLVIAAAIAVFVNAALDAVKIFFNITKRYLPIAAVAVGIFVALVLQPFMIYDHYTMAVAGAIAGLAASGLFDVKKALKASGKNEGF